MRLRLALQLFLGLLTGALAFSAVTGYTSMSAFAGGHNQLKFYTENDVPFGKPFADWIVKWWQSYNYTGWRRNLGDVFMVPAKMQNQDIKERSFKIKKNKAILLSVINWIGSDLNEAKNEIDIVAKEKLDVNLDGKPIGEHSCRVVTPFFKLYGEQRVSDGYWLFFKPEVLENGTHKIDSYGSCRSGKIQIAMDYNLNID